MIIPLAISQEQKPTPTGVYITKYPTEETKLDNGVLSLVMNGVIYLTYLELVPTRLPESPVVKVNVGLEPLKECFED